MYYYNTVITILNVNVIEIRLVIKRFAPLLAVIYYT